MPKITVACWSTEFTKLTAVLISARNRQATQQPPSRPPWLASMRMLSSSKCALFCSLILSIIHFEAVVRAVCPNGISDEQMLSCLHPIEESWQRIRSRKVSLDKAMLQVLFLSRVETRQLCAKLEQARLRCSFDFARCSSSNDALRLVQTGLQFACEHKNPLWHNCTQAVMRNHGQCVLQLTRRDNPAEQCRSLAEFYTCIQEPLQAQCGTGAVAELVKLIDIQSCSLESLLESSAQSDSRQCEKDDREAVDECFEPLENYWRLLRVKDHKLNTIGFPLYTFRAHELEYMCDTVHQIKASCTAVQRCPSRPVVQFANALLGYACGSEQDAFFAHFQCVRESIQSAGQCWHYLQGAWEPGFHREVCPRMPTFFRCILPQLGRKCSTEAISTLVQSIRQYWCDVGTIADVASAIQDSGIELDDRLALLAFGSVKTQKKVTEVSVEQQVEENREDDDDEEEVDVNEQHHQPADADSSNNEDGCAPTRQKRVRDCLAPVFERLVHLHRTHLLENLSLPLYHYGKAEILDLCDLYATAFLQCPFSWFQDCADDAVVSAANSLLGYFCSPQHINAFHEHYDCLSLVIRNRHACSKHLLGSAPGQDELDHNDDQTPKRGASLSCGRVKQFFNCARLAVDRGCPQAASNVFKQSLQQFGCQLD